MATRLVHSLGSRFTRWDVLVFVRAAVVTLVALALTWLVTAITDEGGLSWGQRAGRALPMTPLCSAVGMWGALAPARARGETIAMETLGRSPDQIGAAALAGGIAIAMAVATTIAVARSVDVAGFFPTVARTSHWTWHDGGFANVALGLRVGADGTPERLATTWQPAAAAEIPVRGRAAAAITTALAGTALPLILARALLEVPGRRGRRDRIAVLGPRVRSLGAVVAAVAATVLLFQAAAAGRVPAILGALPWLVLIAVALGSYRASP